MSLTNFPKHLNINGHYIDNMVEIMTKWEYLIPFTQTKEKLHLQDVSSQLKQNHTTVRKYLNHFEEKGILHKSFKGRLTLYELNKNHPYIISILSIVEKERLLKRITSNATFGDLVNQLQKVTNELVIIFGSSVNEYKKAEDIDILTTAHSKVFAIIESSFPKPLHIISVKSTDLVDEVLKKEIVYKHLLVQNVEQGVKWLV